MNVRECFIVKSNTMLAKIPQEDCSTCKEQMKCKELNYWSLDIQEVK